MSTLTKDDPATRAILTEAAMEAGENPALLGLPAELSELLLRLQADQRYILKAISALSPWMQQRLWAVGRTVAGKPYPFDRYWIDPARIMSDAGITPDAWQEQLLRWPDMWTAVLAPRQSGKSSTVAALVLRKVLLEPKQFVIIISASQDLSDEFYMQRIVPMWRALGEPLKKGEPMFKGWTLANKSRVLARAQNSDTSVSFTTNMLVIDEAARVETPVFDAVTPQLATTGGRMVCLSTPKGRKGKFFDIWNRETGMEAGQECTPLEKRLWKKIRVTKDMCPRYTQEFLKAELMSKGPAMFAQEFENQFLTDVTQFFSDEDIDAAFRPSAGHRPLLLRRD